MSTSHCDTQCSCGEGHDHIVMRRVTSDGVHVLLWSDGSLTWALGRSIRGAWFAPAPHRRERALVAGRLVMGEVCLYDQHEVSDLARAARWAAERDGLPGTMRARLRQRRPTLVPSWFIRQTDSQGRTTSREWVLPHLGPLAGLAVIHERGGYHVMHVEPNRETCFPSGIKFKTLRETIIHLESCCTPAAPN